MKPVGHQTEAEWRETVRRTVRRWKAMLRMRQYRAGVRRPKVARRGAAAPLPTDKEE